MQRLNCRISGIQAGHVQGIAIDREKQHLYLSFTTCLLKTDLQGNILGSVTGLAGHLGCIAMHPSGKIYGSLEYKHDKIGAGILNRLGGDIDVEDGFYMAIFDVEKLDRIGMDAEQDGIMTAAYLPDVVADYTAPGHRYGCSGIDGTTFAPLPGGDGRLYLYVAYGIYSDLSRTDNDHQVLLRYDVDKLTACAAPLNQAKMHRNGLAPEEKYFVYTGNTTYGIQNLEYDPACHRLLAAVYAGKKPNYPNFSMYAIDLSVPAADAPLAGLAETGRTLPLATMDCTDPATGIPGSRFPHGATCMIALDDGTYLFSREFKEENGFGTTIGVYRWDASAGFIEQ